MSKQDELFDGMGLHHLALDLFEFNFFRLAMSSLTIYDILDRAISQ